MFVGNISTDVLNSTKVFVPALPLMSPTRRLSPTLHNAQFFPDLTHQSQIPAGPRPAHSVDTEKSAERDNKGIRCHTFNLVDLLSDHL